MAASDSHLEKALAEFNDRVDRLEGTDSYELADALVKRGRILLMMGYSTPAAEDFEDAVDVIESIISSGGRVDSDLCFRAYAVLGSTYCDDDEETMLQLYSKAGGYIKSISDKPGAARIALDCAENLVDADEPEAAKPFINLALCTMGSDDRRLRNIFLQALFLNAEISYNAQDYKDAADGLLDVVKVGRELLEAGSLEDKVVLLIAYTYIADCMTNLQDETAATANLDAVSELLADDAFIRDIDQQSLSDIHGEVGRIYSEVGMKDASEKHLLRQAAYSIAGKDDMLGAALKDKLGRSSTE